MRVLLSMIVEQAIRNRSSATFGKATLRETSTEITLEEYHDAVQLIKDQISAKVAQRQLDLEAF